MMDAWKTSFELAHAKLVHKRQKHVLEQAQHREIVAAQKVANLQEQFENELRAIIGAHSPLIRDKFDLLKHLLSKPDADTQAFNIAASHKALCAFDPDWASDLGEQLLRTSERLAELLKGAGNKNPQQLLVEQMVPGEQEDYVKRLHALEIQRCQESLQQILQLLRQETDSKMQGFALALARKEMEARGEYIDAEREEYARL